jgi:hypothetical protein
MRAIAILTIAMFGILADTAMAQLVIVRPGYVQAPFVRVYRDPFGGAHVRAPFVGVDRPGFFGGTPRQLRYEAPLPARPDYAPPAGTPQGQLFDAMAAFSQSLSQFNTGDTWKSYFALDSGGALSPDRLAHLNGQPTPDLVAMLDRFDSIIANQEYDMISSLPSFARARNELARFVARSTEMESPGAEELPVPAPQRPNAAEDPLLR